MRTHLLCPAETDIIISTLNLCMQQPAKIRYEKGDFVIKKINLIHEVRESLLFGIKTDGKCCKTETSLPLDCCMIFMYSVNLYSHIDFSFISRT